MKLKVFAISMSMAVLAGSAQAVPVQWTFDDWSLAKGDVSVSGSFVYDADHDTTSDVALTASGFDLTLDRLDVVAGGSQLLFSGFDKTSDLDLGFFYASLTGPLGNAGGAMDADSSFLLKSTVPYLSFGKGGTLYGSVLGGDDDKDTPESDDGLPEQVVTLPGNGEEGDGGDKDVSPQPDQQVSAVPLPAGLPMLLTGLAGFALTRRRKRA